MAKTPNLGLHQWGANDAFLRGDFNEDNRKLDEVLRCKTGSYMGNGAENRVIELGARPKLVIVFGYTQGGVGLETITYLMTPEQTTEMRKNMISTSSAPAGCATLTESGFKLTDRNVNTANSKSYYVAFY